MSGLHPAVPLLAAAALLPLARGGARRLVLLAGPLGSLGVWTSLEPGVGGRASLGGLPLVLLRVDGLSLVFGLVFAIIAAIGVVYALHVRRTGEHAATLVYAAGSLGVVFAGDWVTFFLFWELMAVASLFVVWYGGTRRSERAGLRYLLVHIAGGSVLFAGILLHLASGGSLAVEALTATGDVDPLAFWLILLGVAVNAAIPPLHAWLTDAYPEASVTGSVFLSAFTTKTAVYVLLRVFPGAEILVAAGVAMALYGVVYAVLENDIRRLLAYHIVSQVGYMVAGAGMGTALALDGASAHAFSHILYKALLFMGAGAVLQATGRRKLTELGGIADRMPLVVLLYTVGAFSISGVPLFNGFVSKSMIVSAAAEAHRPVAELLLTLASIGTFLHTGLKLPYFTFFGPRRDDIAVAALPRNMIVAMAIGAALCTGFGILPGLLYALLPYGADYHPYTADHVLSALQLLVGTAVGFWMLLAKLGGEPTVSLDTDWLYRRPLAALVAALVELGRAPGRRAEAASLGLVARASRFARNPVAPFVRGEGEPAYDENRYRLPVGVTIFWVVVYFSIVALFAWPTR